MSSAQGRWTRFLLLVMGPAQIGDITAPVNEVDAPVTSCAQCGRPHDQHEVVREPGLTYTRCPQDR